MYGEDFALAKSFRIRERILFQIRGEGFNVLNRVRWSDPNTDVSSAAFGHTSGQGNTPRIIQIALKLTY
jgi:hypothetical protein